MGCGQSKDSSSVQPKGGNQQQQVVVSAPKGAKEIVLITGANKGIGLETARQLGAKGYKVLLGARDAALGAKAAASLQATGLDVRSIVIDVVNVDSIAAAAAQVEREFGRLDVLINNAGVLSGELAKPAELTADAARYEFDVNFFGVLNVTHAFIPLLRKAALPRIVNLSSILGSHTMHADSTSPIYGWTVAPYNASKAALNLYTQNLAVALKDERFKVNAAHPGYVKTDLAPGGMLTVEEGAETSVYLATLGADGPTGGFFFKRDPLPW